MTESSFPADLSNVRPRILIVDDEAAIRNLLLELLGEDYDCRAVGSTEEALERLKREAFELIVSDIQMSGASGLEMLESVRELAPDTVVIMISGQSNIESAIEAMRAGAFDYITKPFSADHVEAAVRRALEHQSLLASKRRYETHLEELVAERTAELEREIIERLRAEEKINRLAYYDSLTNLPNRTLFRDLIERETNSSAGGRKTAVILLALDSFKNINGALGHGIGDRLLREFSRRLTKVLPPAARAAYVGGNEFAVLLTDVSDARDAAQAADDIKSSLEIPFACGAHEIFLTMSIGISIAPDDARDGETLFKNASAALRRARQAGGDCYHFYTRDMHSRALKRLSLETDLRRALDREEFVVHYQPQVCTKTREIIGAEALVRWQHPSEGLVPPAEFIQIAEETGLIVPLGEWVLRTACRQHAAWRSSGLPSLSVSINFSPRQFRQERLVETICDVLDECGMAATSLELELTESTIMHDAQQAIATLNRLKDIGLGISVDDFGSGYSSLSYLKNLPVDVLKIDRAFVREMCIETDSEAIIRAIISLAQNLGLKTIAEGVETAQQASLLGNLGCDALQGYFFSPPVSAEVFETFWRERLLRNSSAHALGKLKPPATAGGLKSV